MSRKSKGINAERELIHKFWAAGYAAIRAAGSGSMKYPCPDIVAGTPSRRLAIECKSTSATYQYLTEETVGQLLEFSKLFCAEPWIAIRFGGEGWYFLNPEDLQSSGKAYSVNIDEAKREDYYLKR
jgi:Holliday junction resolvase - archaeal type